MQCAAVRALAIRAPNVRQAGWRPKPSGCYVAPHSAFRVIQFRPQPPHDLLVNVSEACSMGARRSRTYNTRSGEGRGNQRPNKLVGRVPDLNARVCRETHIKGGAERATNLCE